MIRMFLTKLLSILSTFSLSVGLECGQFNNFNNILTERIVGGENANLGEFPWQVSMQKQTGTRTPRAQWIPSPGGWPQPGAWGSPNNGQWQTIPAIRATPTPPGGWATIPPRPVPYPPTHIPGQPPYKPNPVNQRPSTAAPHPHPSPLPPVTQPHPHPQPQPHPQPHPQPAPQPQPHPQPHPQPAPQPPHPQPQPAPQPQPQPRPPSPSVTTGRWMHFCGGSIINENWILTAAHCVESMKYSYTPGSMRIVMGTLDWRNTNSGSPQIIAISRIVVHDGWNRNTGQNDIALLQTSTPIQFQSASDGTVIVNKVCLSKDANTEYSGEAISSGWGYLNKNSRVSPDILRKVKLPVVDFNTCRNAFSRVIGVTQNQVCAGQAPKGNCMGDSGGPLVQATGSRATQIGIVSFSIPCAVAGYPDVFTKVSRYIDWINQHSGNAAVLG